MGEAEHPKPDRADSREDGHGREGLLPQCAANVYQQRGEEAEEG